MRSRQGNMGAPRWQTKATRLLRADWRTDQKRIILTGPETPTRHEKRG